ncbi:MAG: TatD family hydrolase [bacterium]
MFDTHCHVNFNNYKEDSREIIKDCLDRNIRLIIIGSQYDTSARAIRIAEEYENGVYAAIGLHPIHLIEMQVNEEEFAFKSREEKFDKGRYMELLRGALPLEKVERGILKKIIAIGEIGLDYFHIPANINFEEVRKIQKKGFISQIEFAREQNLPVILHCRGAKDNLYGAYNEMLEILEDFRGKVRGVIHCFVGNLEIAEKFLNLGFYIGFTGIITFKNAGQELLEAVKNIPLNRILAETDCPYLAPEPYRGKRCMPQYVEFTLRKIAELKGVSFEEAEKRTDKNAEELFGI